MSSLIHEWTRYWTARTAVIALDKNGLFDPQHTRIHLQSQIFATKDLTAHPCLALIAEPGLGKTTELDGLFDADHAQMDGSSVLRVDLGGIASLTDLRAAIAQNATVQAWSDADSILTLYLDGLDEGALTYPSIAKALAHELRALISVAEFSPETYAAFQASYPDANLLLKHQITRQGERILLNLADILTSPRRASRLSSQAWAALHTFTRANRLRVRLTCRTADWSQVLEDELQTWWPEHFAVLELAPLTHADVTRAAQDQGVDAAAFHAEVEHIGAGVFAARPLTLTFLLRAYLTHGALPSTQREMYEEGCRRLSDESNDARLDAGHTGTLTSDQKLTVASRLAALMALSNRVAIWTRGEHDSPATDLLIREAVGGQDGEDASRVEVTQSTVRETLGSALFSSRGVQRLGWAHRTYAEYLAARYLAGAKLRPERLHDLLRVPGDPSGKVIPQLREVAAWLAVLVPELGRRIAREDPDTLLHSAALQEDQAGRALLAEALLDARDHKRSMTQGWQEWDTYRRLKHDGLADQLRPWIANKEKASEVRRLALKVAQRCEGQALWPDLLAIALDETESHEVRVVATQTATELMPPEDRHALVPLALSASGVDPGDELKGAALHATWPGSLTTTQLLTTLTAPSTPDVLGLYKMFLKRDDLWQHVPNDDLPQVLRWTGDPNGGLWMFSALPGSMQHIEWREVADNLYRRAWASLEAPGVLDAFTLAVRPRLLHHAGLTGKWGEDVRRDVSKRHSLIAHLITRHPPAVSELTWLTWREEAPLSGVDVPWLMERLQASENSEERTRWITLLRALAHTVEAQSCFADQQLPDDLQAALAPLRPRELTAEEQAMNQEMARLLAEQEAERTARLALPSPQEQIAGVMELIHRGGADEWWKIPRLLVFDQERRSTHDDFELDLRQTPAWPHVPPNLQQEVIAAAPAYLSASNPETDQWFGTLNLHFGALAGVKALTVLLAERPEVLQSLPPNVWEKWTPALLNYHPGAEQDARPVVELYRRAYQHAPEEFITRFAALVRAETAEHGRPLVSRHVQSFMDARLARALLDALGTVPVHTGDMVEEVLAAALQGNPRDTLHLAEVLIENRAVDMDAAVGAAAAVAREAAKESWSSVWTAVQADRAFGRAVVERLAARTMGPWNKVTPHLSEAAAAELFVWLDQEYPRTTDQAPARSGPGSSLTSTDDLIDWWRGGVITDLERRGTLDAVKALRELGDRLPDWRAVFTRAAYVAEERVRRLNWVPLRPADVLTLVGSARARLVRDGTHLLDLVVETLAVLQSELQGEIPMAQALWDSHSQKPKGEEDFSDFVASYLRRALGERGVVVNREVVIRRKVMEGGAPGERTDIHVDAVVKDPREDAYGTVTVVIEAKGCWNRGLETAMQAQLVDRYLIDNTSRHGLYLVGWFVCPQWSKSDGRRNDVPHTGLDEARALYNAQARSISSGGEVNVRAVVLDASLR